jgi:hypothetical protein
VVECGEPHDPCYQDSDYDQNYAYDFHLVPVLTCFRYPRVYTRFTPILQRVRLLQSHHGQKTGRTLKEALALSEEERKELVRLPTMEADSWWASRVYLFKEPLINS